MAAKPAARRRTPTKTAPKAPPKGPKRAARSPTKRAQKAVPRTPRRPRHGEFLWNELMTRDDARAMDFFARVLGWGHRDLPTAPGEPPYRLMHRDGRQVAGIVKMTEPKFPPPVPTHWCGYVAVDDVDRRAALVKEHGGELVHGPQSIPNVGRFLILKDPTGAVLGFLTPEGGTA